MYPFYYYAAKKMNKTDASSVIQLESIDFISPK